jgi:nitrate/TMAO reductase-like tetraheme cytochrome c subunit
MITAMQTAKAQKYHSAIESKGKTCIDCHAGIAHPDHSEGLAAAPR